MENKRTVSIVTSEGDTIWTGVPDFPPEVVEFVIPGATRLSVVADGDGFQDGLAVPYMLAHFGPVSHIIFDDDHFHVTNSDMSLFEEGLNRLRCIVFPP